MTSTKPTTRHTWQRAAVRDLLEGGEEFRTAQQLHDQLREVGAKVGLATVYRALQAMAEAGEVDVLRTPDGEATYRRCSSGHHHHLVCRSCGSAVEIAFEGVEERVNAIARENGFTAVDHSIELHGLCAACSP